MVFMLTFFVQTHNARDSYIQSVPMRNLGIRQRRSERTVLGKMEISFCDANVSDSILFIRYFSSIVRISAIDHLWEVATSLNTFITYPSFLSAKLG